LNRRFEFQKRRQLFIRTHNETLSIAGRCASKNPDSWASLPLQIAPESFLIAGWQMGARHDSRTGNMIADVTTEFPSGIFFGLTNSNSRRGLCFERAVISAFYALDEPTPCWYN
jgi:hypothetical protein